MLMGPPGTPGKNFISCDTTSSEMGREGHSEFVTQAEVLTSALSRQGSLSV